MPNRKTHGRAGRTAGGVFAAYRAKDQSVVNFAIETVSGRFGGQIGALAADVIEPAISSYHRGPAHSCVAGAAILSLLGDAVPQIESYCRYQADEKAEQRRTVPMKPDLILPNTFVPTPNSALTQLFLAIAELFWRALAGFMNGMAAGYLSHLVLDAGTPRSIPLLTHGF
jgi:hypothetical protein